MNFTALDIIHFWTDSRGKLIQKVLPTKGKIYVYCTVDLSSEAAKVCAFINLVVKQIWTFQMKNDNERFIITFSAEAVTLETLFQKEPQAAVKKKPRAKRENAGMNSNLKNHELLVK